MSGSALELWRRELRERTRTPHTFDDLWKAACAEMFAVEEPWRAEAHLTESWRIIRQAAKQQARAVA